MTDPEHRRLQWKQEWDAESERLLILRAKAIDAYAGIEAQLANVFSALLDIDQDLGTLVFYRIVNSRSRNAMMQDLIARKYDKTYKRYWDSLIRFITKLDTQRNIIVHWHMAAGMTPKGQMPALNHPKYFFSEDHMDGTINSTEIEDFTLRAKFASHSIEGFWLVSQNITIDPAEQTTWRETFLQPVAYPPPEAHPLSRLLREGRTPPRPFPA